MGDYKAQRKASAIDGQNIKWNWGDDWPDALDVISRGVQGRPLSKIFSTYRSSTLSFETISSRTFSCRSLISSSVRLRSMER